MYDCSNVADNVSFQVVSSERFFFEPPALQQFHRKKSGGVTSGYREDQSPFEIILLPKKRSISSKAWLDV
jgi:hypothetical protein